MSSFRTLVFKEIKPDKAWMSSGREMTLIVRRTVMGYVALLQKWSDEANARWMDVVSLDEPLALFSTKEAAESACQRRYEQELRWMHTRLR